jgi:hypothetical protein
MALRTRLRGMLPGLLTYKGCYDITGIIGNMVLGNSGFTMRKNFSENYLQFWNLSSKLLATSVLGSISSKNISLKGFQIIRLAGASICFGLALMALLLQNSLHV